MERPAWAPAVEWREPGLNNAGGVGHFLLAGTEGCTSSFPLFPSLCQLHGLGPKAQKRGDLGGAPVYSVGSSVSVRWVIQLMFKVHVFVFGTLAHVVPVTICLRGRAQALSLRAG